MLKTSKKERSEIVKALSFFSQVGFTITACILIGVLIGRFLDNHFGASPWFLLLFAFLGAAAAFKFLFDIAKRK